MLILAFFFTLNLRAQEEIKIYILPEETEVEYDRTVLDTLEMDTEILFGHGNNTTEGSGVLRRRLAPHFSIGGGVIYRHGEGGQTEGVLSLVVRFLRDITFKAETYTDETMEFEVKRSFHFLDQSIRLDLKPTLDIDPHSLEQVYRPGLEIRVYHKIDEHFSLGGEFLLRRGDPPLGFGGFVVKWAR